MYIYIFTKVFESGDNWQNPLTFVIEPTGDLLIDVIVEADAQCKQDVGQVFTEVRHVAFINPLVHPVL